MSEPGGPGVLHCLRHGRFSYRCPDCWYWRHGPSVLTDDADFAAVFEFNERTRSWEARR